MLNPPKAKTSRGRVGEVLRRGVSLGRLATGWREDLKWLFDLRDRSVHYLERTEPPAQHPLGHYVSGPIAEWTPESAERAVNLLMSVLSTSATNPSRAVREGRVAPSIVNRLGLLRARLARSIGRDVSSG